MVSVRKVKVWGVMGACKICEQTQGRLKWEYARQREKHMQRNDSKTRVSMGGCNQYHMAGVQTKRGSGDNSIKKTISSSTRIYQNIW